MASVFLWPSEDGWPYPDPAPGTDPDTAIDEDLIALRARAPRLLDGLDPIERAVVAARFGLDGTPVRSMKELQADLGLPRADLRAALGSGLSKLRAQLA
jgi:DNA-directed RNA polymerase sigma subunit (sigma70/sigma32)